MPRALYCEEIDLGEEKVRQVSEAQQEGRGGRGGGACSSTGVEGSRGGKLICRT